MLFQVAHSPFELYIMCYISFFFSKVCSNKYLSISSAAIYIIFQFPEIKYRVWQNDTYIWKIRLLLPRFSGGCTQCTSELKLNFDCPSSALMDFFPHHIYCGTVTSLITDKLYNNEHYNWISLILLLKVSPCLFLLLFLCPLQHFPFAPCFTFEIDEQKNKPIQTDTKYV